MPGKIKVIIHTRAKKCPVCEERPAVRHGFASCENTACWLCIVPGMLIHQWNARTWIGAMQDKITELRDCHLADARGQAVDQGQRADAEARQTIEWEKWADRLAVVAERRRERIKAMEADFATINKILESELMYPNAQLKFRTFGLGPYACPPIGEFMDLVAYCCPRVSGASIHHSGRKYMVGSR